MDYREPNDINREINGLGSVWVYLNEYRLTHGYLHLLITDEHFKRRADLYLTDCLHICGPTSGGPWRLRLEAHPSGAQSVLTLSTSDDLFVVKAIRAQLTID
jgi:hypothetical protein